MVVTKDFVTDDLIGPVVGSFITESHLGWRWTAWLILILAAVFGIPSFFIVPETYAPVLKERAARKLDPDASVKTNPFDGFMRKYLSKPMMMLLKEPMVCLIPSDSVSLTCHSLIL